MYIGYVSGSNSTQFTLGNSTPSLDELACSISAVRWLLRNLHGSKSALIRGLSYGYFLNWKKVNQITSFGSKMTKCLTDILVCDWLNITVPNQWIGRTETPNKACIAWSPRSSDLTPCDLSVRVHKGS
ncbi:hypothetical protein TNCV_5083531 [Trichonephila clavipes]|nr:hypothetical protein TNCV_5083531 [Trichonephila clavipes]